MTCPTCGKAVEQQHPNDDHPMYVVTEYDGDSEVYSGPVLEYRCPDGHFFFMEGPVE